MGLESGNKPIALTYDNSIAVDPSFSPNGRWLSYVSSRYGNPHIFRAELKWDSSKESFKIGFILRLVV